MTPHPPFARQLLFWLLLLTALLAALPAAAAPERLASDRLAGALETLDRAAATERAHQDLPALALAIVHGDDLVWQHQYGDATLEPRTAATAETRFCIGSVTKLLTALATVQLRDSGKLDLDDRVTRALPWFRLKDEPHPATTIRELLLQLSGLAREPIGLSWADRSMPTREDLIAEMPSERVTVRPESHWKYSNLGYALLGLIVESASGQSYADYVGDRILKPLGMTETVVGAATPPTDTATGYGVRTRAGRIARPFLPTGGMTPAAGACTTASDLARFASWMVSDSDGPVLSARSRAEMERVQAMPAGWTTGQGLGFEVRHDGTSTRIGHGGRAAGFGAVVEVDAESRLGVVAMANADDASLRRLVEQAFTLLAPILPPPAPEPARSDPAWRKYVGRYVFDGRESEVALVDGRLVWQDPTASDPAETRITLQPVRPNVFRFASGGLAGEDVTFELNKDGSVRRMLAGGGYDWKQ